jgi:hypothetical protein
MTSLPRADSDGEFVITGRLWNRLAEAVERADRLMVGAPLSLIERQGGKLLTVGRVSTRGVVVQVTGAALNIASSGGSGGTVTVTGSGKYGGVILGDRAADIDYTSDLAVADFGSTASGGSQQCLIVNLAELQMVEWGYTPSRWLDPLIDRVDYCLPGVLAKSNSDGIAVVYVCFIPYSIGSPVGCPSGSSS